MKTNNMERKGGGIIVNTEHCAALYWLLHSTLWQGGISQIYTPYLCVCVGCVNKLCGWTVRMSKTDSCSWHPHDITLLVSLINRQCLVLLWNVAEITCKL